MQIFPIECRLQERFGRAEPLPVLDGGLQVGEAEVILAVDVQDFVASIFDGVKKRVR
jgi:hypothetical protein